MTTIKSFTDLQQSKKLAEILPLESADMLYYCDKDNNTPISQYPFIRSFKETNTFSYLHCWSLASLLSVIPKIINNETLFIGTSAALWHVGYRNIYFARTDNLIDACCELILKLHELKML